MNLSVLPTFDTVFLHVNIDKSFSYFVFAEVNKFNRYCFSLHILVERTVDGSIARCYSPWIFSGKCINY